MTKQKEETKFELEELSFEESNMVLTDIRISYWRMVEIILKMSFALLPVYVIWAVILALFGGLVVLGGSVVNYFF